MAKNESQPPQGEMKTKAKIANGTAKPAPGDACLKVDPNWGDYKK